MKKRKIFALMMASIMLLSACGQKPADSDADKDVSQESSKKDTQTQESEIEDEESKYPEYLNLDSAYPVIKDEYKDELSHKVTAMFGVDAGTTREFDELWIDTYYNEKYNLDFEVKMVAAQALGEQKTLALNSGDMPDMMWMFFMSSSELYKYGAVEGILLPLDEYISEELCPNIYKQVIENDFVRNLVTAPDGHIYSLPYLDEENQLSSFPNRYWINEKYLETIGKDLPTTVDEFVDVMYALKEKDPSGLGSENFYPLGMTMQRSLAGALMNGFGYVSTAMKFYGNSASIRDGEVVIPAYDMDVFQEYLKIMNQFYKDGIIHPSCFTMEETAAISELLTGATAGWETPVDVFGVQDWENWGAMIPLTSDWQEEPETCKPTHVQIGNFVVSADTEYPELILRFADQYFNNEEGCSLDFWGGVPANSEWATEGFVFNTVSEDGTSLVAESEYTDGVGIYAYYCNYLHGQMPLWGNYGSSEAYVKQQLDAGIDPEKVKTYYDLDPTDPNQYGRLSIYERMYPYATAGFPTIYYVDEKTNQRITDLETVIYPYIEEQVALFITGGRSLSETDAFVAELETMGIKELLDIYRSIMDSRQ